MKVNDKCPYDPAHKNTGVAVNKSHRWFAVCPVCGKSARVTIYARSDGSKSCALSKSGRPFTGMAKEVFSVRLSAHEKKSLEADRATLTIRNNRLQLLYKH